MKNTHRKTHLYKKKRSRGAKHKNYVKALVECQTQEEAFIVRKTYYSRNKNA